MVERLASSPMKTCSLVLVILATYFSHVGVSLVNSVIGWEPLASTYRFSTKKPPGLLTPNSSTKKSSTTTRRTYSAFGTKTKNSPHFPAETFVRPTCHLSLRLRLSGILLTGNPQTSIPIYWHLGNWLFENSIIQTHHLFRTRKVAGYLCLIRA